MVEMLRKLDRFATAFPLGLLMLFSVESRASEIDMRLEAAIHREVVVGDLKGAMEEYKSILDAGSKESAAKALLQMGQCLEKLGRHAEAQEAYRRIVRQYGDQTEIVARARGWLAVWEDSFPGPRNLRFEQGAPGKAPPGWFVTAPPKDADQWAELYRTGCRSNRGCAVVRTPDNAPIRVGGLEQTFSATAYRGKSVRLRAWIRMEGGDPEDRAQMWLSVDRAEGLTDQPVRSAEWTRCEIVTRIAEDATSIRFGFMSFGRGRAWVDDISVEAVK
jgi:tetratricopeptide (TPR) repeat protein